MEEIAKDRLCAGTFFTLLANARRTQPTYAQRYKGVFSDISEPYLLYALGRVTTPDLPSPMRTELDTLTDNACDLKTCKNFGGRYCNFSSASVRAAFTERIKTAYDIPLQAMFELTDCFIETATGAKKDEYLVKALVEVIAQDDSIDDGQLFYVCEDGGTMTKDEIGRADTICLQPFLLGIWHYALTQVDNKVGAETYARWCPPQNRAPRIYMASIGETSSRRISVTSCSLPEARSMVFPQSAEAEDAGHLPSAGHCPASGAAEAEAEVVEPEQRAANIQQNIERPFIFNFTQTGNNNTQIGSITNYYAGNSEGK